MRARKWARRHKSAVWAAGAVLLVTLFGLAASSVAIAAAYKEQVKQRGIAERQEGLAKQERDTAEDRLYLADMQRASQYLAAADMVRLKETLESHRPRAEQRDRRGWEWYYLRSLCDRELFTIQDDPGGLVRPEWFGGGGSLMVANTIGGGWQGFRVWDLDERRGVASPRWQRRGVLVPTGSPDGSRIAWIEAEPTEGVLKYFVRVWNVADGKVERSLPTSNYRCFLLAWSPDGRRIAARAEESGRPLKAGEARPVLTVWDAGTGEKLSTCRTSAPEPKRFGNPGMRLSWSPDGKLLSLGGDEESDDLPAIRTWEADSGRESRVFRVEPERKGMSIWWHAWSPDSSRLAVTMLTGQAVHVLDASTGNQLFALPGTGGVTWSPDGSGLAAPSAAEPWKVIVWDPATGRERFTLRGHDLGFGEMMVAWSPDGRRLAATNQSAQVKVWDLARGQDYTRVGGHAEGVKMVSWSPDGRHLMSVAWDATVKVWDTERGQERSGVRGVPGAYGAAWSPDGSQLAVLLLQPGGLKDVQSNPLVAILDARTGKGDRTLSGSARTLNQSSGPPLTVRWRRDGKRLACESVDASVKAWDLTNGREVEMFPFPILGDWEWYGFEWDPEGRLLAVGFKGGTLLVDPERPAECRVIPGLQCRRNQSPWSPDGRQLALIEDEKVVRFWGVSEGRVTGVRLEQAGSSVDALAWSPKGDRVATISNGTIRIWDPATGRELLSIPDRAWSLSWSPDGKRLASGGEDGSVKVRDASAAYSTGPPAAPGEGPLHRERRARALHQQGVLLSRLGRHAEAEVAFNGATAGLEELCAEFPDFPSFRDPLKDLLLDRARLLRRAGRWAEAERDYRRARTVYEDRWKSYGSYLVDIQMELAQMFQELGQEPRAVAEFTEAANLGKRYGTSVAKLNQIAWFLVTRGDPGLDNAPLAVELVQVAVRQAPTGGALWNTLGVAQYRAGDWRAAIAALENSMQRRRGGDSFDFFFLAMAHWQLGERDQAKEWYGKAVAWMDKNKPNDEELLRFRAEASNLLGVKEVPTDGQEGAPGKE
jgi:WD40 repeat protein